MFENCNFSPAHKLLKVIFNLQKEIYKILILWIISFNYAYSQKLVPPIQNYSPKEYGAASQNWDIALNSQGVVYAANNQGLLEYDGLSWTLYPLESKSIIRSVFPYKDRIYTGSFQEFGYWIRDEKGQLFYTSLKPLMAKIDLRSDEFWDIMAYKGAIYFRSFGGIFKYKDEAITKVKDIVSTSMCIYKQKLVAARRDGGLVFIESDNTQSIFEGNLKLLEGKNIVELEALGDTLYIGTPDALYSYNDNQLKKFPSEKLNSLLTKYELNHVISVSNNEILLGTLKNGIIRYNLDSKDIDVYDRSLGLQNNTVLGMAYSKKKLWLALDKGVDAIDLDSPINFYTDKTGEIGAVYDMLNYKGNYYIASNTGIYTFHNKTLYPIKNAEDHAWNLEELEGILYANHNTGVYKIINDEFIPIEDRTGSYTIMKVNDSKGDLLVCHYTGLSLYNPESGDIHELDSINFPVKQLVIENNNSLWAAHPYQGIYHLTTDENFEVKRVKPMPPIDGKKNFNPNIYKVNNQLIAYLNSTWFKYNPFQERFEVFREFKKYKNCRLAYVGEDTFIFINEKDGSTLYTDLKNETIIIPPEKFNYRLVKSNENFIRENDSIFYATLNDGFARINFSKLKRRQNNEWKSTPFIKQFSDDQNKYVLTEDPIIPYKDSRSITVKVGLPVSESLGLQYILSGADSLKGETRSGNIDLRNLKHGDYTLQLGALGAGANKREFKEFNFSIAPPWYLSTDMKILYILVLIVIMMLVYGYNKQKLKKHQLQLEEKFEKEHMERLNMLEKEKLMNEIDLKRKELANTTMMAAKKNEVLMEIQGELNKDKNKFSNQFRLKHIMNKINNAVKNKDEWKVFETNFNEVHEDFFKDLLKEYPKLTSKDLKLCSYLKMNLSSKEIAPLMGISVRGVEVHRYRLRKKMTLDGDVNLTKFLIKNF